MKQRLSIKKKKKNFLHIPRPQSPTTQTQQPNKPTNTNQPHVIDDSIIIISGKAEIRQRDEEGIKGNASDSPGRLIRPWRTYEPDEEEEEEEEEEGEEEGTLSEVGQGEARVV